MIEHEATLRFERPPVVHVSIDVLFDNVEGLKVTSLSELITEFRSSFPNVEERFAQESWIDEEQVNVSDSGQVDAETTEVFDVDSSFPFPWLTFDDNSGHMIGFQGDRLSIDWTFSEEHHYPGFFALGNELLKRFEQFEAAVDEHTSSAVNIKQVRLQYDNFIPTSSPLISSALLHGLPIPEAGKESDWDIAWTAFNGTVRFPDAEVRFTSGSGASPVPFLGVRSKARRGESEESVDMLLKAAHSRLIEVFDRLTTEEQKIGWGVER